LSEKIWYLDYSKQNANVNGEDCGKALAANVNASLPEHEKRIRSAPNKNNVNGWKRESTLRERFENEFAQGTSNKVRAGKPTMRRWKRHCMSGFGRCNAVISH
jgi:hypothetical protein